MSNLSLEKAEKSPEYLQSQALEYMEVFSVNEREKFLADKLPRLITMLESGELSEQTAVALLVGRYEPAHYFHEILKVLIAKFQSNGLAQKFQTILTDEMVEALVPNSPLVAALRDNYRDEIGRSGGYDGGEAHAVGRKRLLEALGVNYEEFISRKASFLDGSFASISCRTRNASRDFLFTYERTIDENPLKAASMFVYHEGRLARDGQGEYPHLVRGLEKVFPHLKKENGKYGPKDALWHPYSHGLHDDEHMRQAMEGLIQMVQTEQDLQSIKDGQCEGRRMHERFWRGLYDELYREYGDQLLSEVGKERLRTNRKIRLLVSYNPQKGGLPEIRWIVQPGEPHVERMINTKILDETKIYEEYELDASAVIEDSADSENDMHTFEQYIQLLKVAAALGDSSDDSAGQFLTALQLSAQKRIAQFLAEHGN